MIVIRAKQMSELGNAVVQTFEHQMAHHLRQYAGRHCEVIGDEKLMETIHLGIGRAKVYGFTCHGPVRFFVEMMFNLGSYFDTDPQYPWVAEILLAPGFRDQMARSEALYTRAMDFFAKTVGHDNEYSLQALRQVFWFLQKPYAQLDMQNVAESLLPKLHHVYPQKCAYVRDEPLRRLVDEGVKIAGNFQCATQRGVYLMVGLMFALGHGLADDPLYPWVNRTLTDPGITDVEIRVSRLEEKTLTYFDHALKYLEERHNHVQ